MGNRHFGGQLLYGNDHSPFDGIPLEFANAFLRRHIGVKVGNSDYLGPIVAGSAGGWTMTDIAGTGAVTQNNEGALVITTGTSDENRTQLQHKLAPFKYSTTKKLVCFARLKVSTQATSDAFFGLASIDTTVVTAAAGAVDVDDGIFFFKTATADDFTFEVGKDSTYSTVACGLDLADDTYVILGFIVEGGVIKWFALSDPSDKMQNMDDTPGLLGSGTVIVNTNAPDDTDLALTFICGQEGGTTARVLTVDWAFACQEK